MRVDVDKLMVDQLPIDLLFGDPAVEPAVAQVQEEEQRPRKKRKLPSTKGVVIEVAPVQESHSTAPPVDEPVLEQAPVPAA